MTLLEKAKELRPEMTEREIIEEHCPFGNMFNLINACECVSTKNGLPGCEQCWNKSYVDPNEPKPKEPKKEVKKMTLLEAAMKKFPDKSAEYFIETMLCPWVGRYDLLSNDAENQKCPPVELVDKYFEKKSPKNRSLRKCTCCWNRLYDEDNKCVMNKINGVEEDAPTEPSESSDPVNPNHYKTNPNGLETIDEMRAVFGDEVVANFCLGNVWKYRARALHKNGQEDLDKANWYMNKYVELQADIKKAKDEAFRIKLREGTCYVGEH